MREIFFVHADSDISVNNRAHMHMGPVLRCALEFLLCALESYGDRNSRHGEVLVLHFCYLLLAVWKYPASVRAPMVAVHLV